jgi:hypothetical protein
MKYKAWGRKQSQANLKSYSDVCLERLKITAKDWIVLSILHAWWGNTYLYHISSVSESNNWIVLSILHAWWGNTYLYHISSVSESNISLIAVKSRIQINEIFT